MESFPTSRIHNVALVGHAGSGKTTLAEALLHVSGGSVRRGRVEDGTTVGDFDPEEQRRGMSLSLSVIPIVWEDHKVNLLDTPGYPDFVAEVAAAFRVAEFALFVVSAVEGVEVQTELAWRMAEELGLPRAVFINKLDRERSDFTRTVEQLKERLAKGIAPLELPIGAEGTFRGVIDLLDDHAMVYEGSSTGTEIPIPDELVDEEHMVHDALIEGIVVADDALMERYLAEEPIRPEELEVALATGIAEASVFPVLCGSATKLIGIDRLARFLVHETPTPPAAEGPAAAFVFKTLVDPYLGRINVMKVIQGRIATDERLTNGRTLTEERLHNLFCLRGKEQLTIADASAGDIVAVAKLTDTGTGDVLGRRGAEVKVPPLELPPPVLGIAVVPKTKGDDDKLATALHRVCDEDPALQVERDTTTDQTILRGMGETHLAIAIEKLARKFGVSVLTEELKVAYRETVTGRAEAEGKYKKQSGGHGQFGVASLRIEPLERGAGLQFVDAIVGGAIPRQFIPAVEKGVIEAMHAGPHGFPVVDVKVTCFDGKYHTVDSSEMSFKMAGVLAFREAMAKASPIVLEPVCELVVSAPSSCQGDLLGDLNGRRARILGTVTVGDTVQITASVPAAELTRYAVDLRSLTRGRGTFTAAQSHYDVLPPNLAAKVTAKNGEGATPAR